MSTVTQRHEIKLTLQTGGERQITQTFQNPLSNSDTLVTGITEINTALLTNDFWYEDPRTEKESDEYTNDNKITKIIKADIFEQTKTVENNKTTLVEVTETIYQEAG